MLLKKGLEKNEFCFEYVNLKVFEAFLGEGLTGSLRHLSGALWKHLGVKYLHEGHQFA